MSQTAAQSDRGAAGPAAKTKPIIRLVNVDKAFGTLRVLNRVSLDFMPGQTTVVIGPSGVGKSVLLKHIVGLIKPDRGQVWYHDQRIDKLAERSLVQARKTMGFLFQRGALFDSMTVEQNVSFPLRQHTGLKPSQRRERCARVLRMVGLDGTQAKMPAQLSGGQRKRVALARAIVLEPELVLYDEPTTGLDPIRADVINELIIALAKQIGITSVVVTHDMASANKIADRIVMLYDANIIADAPPEALQALDDDIVQRFIHGRAEQEDLDQIRRGFESTKEIRNEALKP